MAKIIRYCLKDESHEGPNNCIVARPCVLSNPYTHIKGRKTLAKFVVPTREEAIRRYEMYFDIMVKTDKLFKKEWDDLFQKYLKYDTLYIGCYCPKSESCHSDVIIKKLRQRALKYIVEQKMSKGSQES